MKSSFDILIVGGGPAGYVSAIRAAQLGLSTALIEKKKLGGVCLNWGCIPTKALLKSSYLFHTLHHMASFGIHVSDLSFSLETMITRSRSVAHHLGQGVEGLLKKNGVQVFYDKAVINQREKDNEWSVTLSQTQTKLKARHIVIATGSRPRRIFNSIPGLWTSAEAMTPTSLPRSLLVVGGGAIGLEFASFYHGLGVPVEVVEQSNTLLISEDEEIQSAALKELTQQGISFHLQSQVESIEKETDEGFTVTLSQQKTQTKTLWHGSHVLLAIGVIGNIENLGLENTNVQLDNSFIRTDPWGYTHENGIYAIGDVAGAPWLAHKASHEGIICIEKIAGHHPEPLDKDSIPGCIYTWPQIARVGLTEKQLRENGKSFKKGFFSFRANGQALAHGETVGFTKVLFDKETGALLGAHMIGPYVSEMIQGFAIAKSLEATESDLKRVVFPHPTFSESMHEAILDADGEALHKMPSS